MRNLIPVILPAYTTHEDGTECSETSAYKIQTPGDHPKERIQHSEQGESLKSRIAVISYRRFGTTYRSHSHGSRIQKKACSPSTEFIRGTVCAVESLSSVVSANRVDACVWMEAFEIVSATGERRSMIGVLTV
jgi:hypothetical protein